MIFFSLARIRQVRIFLAAMVLSGTTSYIFAAEAPIVDGVVKKNYPSGQIMSELNYLNGKLDGICIDYYKNGQIMYEWSYRNDKLQGTSRAYSMDGKLVTKWSYKKGVLHGKSVEYHPNRKKKKVEVYRNGEVVRRRVYNEKGKLVERFDLPKDK